MDIREHSIFISWEVGEGGRVEGFGGNHIIFQGGVVVRISCVQQSTKWELQKIDCQLTTNAYGGGRESWELQNLMGGSGKFYCVTIKKSSDLPSSLSPPTFQAINNNGF